MRKKKSVVVRVSLTVLICLLIIALLLFSPFVVDYFRSASISEDGTKSDSVYYMDDNYEHVANIPKDSYLSSVSLPSDKTVFDVRDTGASTTNSPLQNNAAISEAIKKASEVNGVVLVSGGVYRTTRVELKSDITLRIDENSALEAITYDECVAMNQTGESLALLYGNNLQNVTIEGPGKLIGNGATFCDEQEDSSPFFPLDTFNLKKYVLEHRKRIKMGKTNEMSRDYLIGLHYCENVTIRNLELYEAGSWTVRLEGLVNVLIEDVVIDNDVRVANSDGFDLIGGKDIAISHCFIATGDDAICPKTEQDSPALDNLTVENCEIMSLANCFKIGTAVHQNISNVLVKDCFFFLPGIAGGYAGIAIEAPDGGKVSNVVVQNVTMENITSPFVIWEGKRNNDGGKIDGVKLENITATNCDIGGAITGYKNGGTVNPVQNVELTNINIVYRECKEKLHLYPFSGNAYDGSLNMFGYPEITKVSHMYVISNEFSLYFDLPTSGVFIRYADGVTIDNFRVKARSESTLPLTNYNDKAMKNSNVVVTNSDFS